ncbi:MAG: DUF262 domain-containing protein [Bacteroidetes bacterium]|nr:MAG: DUF262 domain-containing protein [Bacteroidota bacterium]
MIDNENVEVLDIVEEEEIAVPIPKEERKLITQPYDKSIEDLVNMIEKKKILLDPEFQRNYVWDTKKASLLIESILLNVPIPVVYASQEKETFKWLIVDGVQRLTSLKRFFDGEFKLKGLEVLGTEQDKNLLNGLDYESLPPIYRNTLDNGIIRIVLISEDSHPEIKYDMFMRLNRGSIHLNEQELRNCLYRGSFNDALKNDLRENEIFLELINFKEKHNKFLDSELILRFLAIHQNWDKETKSIKNYKGSMKTFLNDFMRENQKADKTKLEIYKSLFDSTIEKVYEVLGNKAFSKINTLKEYEKTLNRGIMDCVMIGFSFFDKNALFDKKEQVFDMMFELMKDTEFQESISTSTTSTQKINFRIAKFYSLLNDLMNG